MCGFGVVESIILTIKKEKLSDNVKLWNQIKQVEKYYLKRFKANKYQCSSQVTMTDSELRNGIAKVEISIFETINFKL